MLSQSAARFARRREPGAVGGERPIGGVDAADERARERAALVGQAVERPGALALALGEARFDQQLEMARDARLRLAENGDQFAHRQFGFAEQPDQAQARHFARRLKARQQRLEAHFCRSASGARRVRHKDMFMSNFGGAQAAA